MINKKQFVVNINTRDSLDVYFIAGHTEKEALEDAFIEARATGMLFGCDIDESFDNDVSKFQEWIDMNNTAHGFSREFGITITEVPKINQ